MSLNLYYDPQKFGLEPVGTIDFSSGSYEFDYLCIWKDAAGNYLWGSDSGCSCPTPFENQGVNSLAKGTAHQAAAAIQERLNNRSEYELDYRYGENDAIELIGRLMAVPATIDGVVVPTVKQLKG